MTSVLSQHGRMRLVFGDIGNTLLHVDFDTELAMFVVATIHSAPGTRLIRLDADPSDKSHADSLRSAYQIADYNQPI